MSTCACPFGNAMPSLIAAVFPACFSRLLRLLLSPPQSGRAYGFTHHRRQMRSPSEPPNIRPIHETYTIIVACLQPELQQLNKPSLRPVRE